jgi:hypothetical protein
MLALHLVRQNSLPETINYFGFVNLKARFFASYFFVASEIKTPSNCVSLIDYNTLLMCVLLD